MKNVSFYKYNLFYRPATACSYIGLPVIISLILLYVFVLNRNGGSLVHNMSSSMVRCSSFRFIRYMTKKSQCNESFSVFLYILNTLVMHCNSQIYSDVETSDLGFNSSINGIFKSFLAALGRLMND